MLPAGTQLGNYRILRTLGSGGMADVYEAEDQMLGRRVALKVLPPEFGRNPQLVARFEKEVRSSAVLNHSGIVTVFEVGHAEGVHYYSMRLLTGGDLRGRIEQGLSELEALSILREVTDAFVHAHAAGFVHRDVKPENILFDEQGRAVLTDFGIAKAITSESKMTATGVSIGTPRYISPEQARGKPVDARADLYSLGCILYEMLTGSPPYDGDEPLAVIFKHVTEPVPRLPEQFAQYQELVDSLMAKDVAQRPESATELLMRLEPLLPAQRTGSLPRLATGAFRTPTQGNSLPTIVTSERDHVERLAKEEQRQREAEAARRQADDDARLRAAEEAARAAEAEARRKADEARALADQAERARREAEAARRAEAERERQAELARQQAEEDERKRVAAEAERQRREEEARQRAEAERRAVEEAARRKAEEAERKRLADEAERQRREEEQRRKAEETAARKAEKDRLALEAAARKRAESERRAAEVAAENRRREEERRRKAEEKEKERAAALAARQQREAEKRQQKEAQAALGQDGVARGETALARNAKPIAIAAGGLVVVAGLAWWLMRPAQSPESPVAERVPEATMAPPAEPLQTSPLAERSEPETPAQTPAPDPAADTAVATEADDAAPLPTASPEQPVSRPVIAAPDTGVRPRTTEDESARRAAEEAQRKAQADAEARRRAEAERQRLQREQEAQALREAQARAEAEARRREAEAAAAAKAAEESAAQKPAETEDARKKREDRLRRPFGF